MVVNSKLHLHARYNTVFSPGYYKILGMRRFEFLIHSLLHHNNIMSRGWIRQAQSSLPPYHCSQDLFTRNEKWP